MDQLEYYNILNAVKPANQRSKYPYSVVDKDKIIFTQKKITIVAKELKSADRGKSGGAVSKIRFYG